MIKKRTAPSIKAPGPDGFRLGAWRRSSDKMLEWIRHTFNLCLKNGEFPAVWKCANLVLISKVVKPNLPEDNLPKVRPICLLDKIGKAFERVITGRIKRWQVEHLESDFSPNQFSFRKQRSTSNALLLVREITSTAARNGGCAIVISLDIRNAFNSIPWSVVRGSLRRKGFPNYLRRIVDSYLSESDPIYRAGW